MSDILSDAREWLRENPVGERMGRAHDSECHRRHLECLVSRMAAEIERLREERRWISVEERLPEALETVLVYHLEYGWWSTAERHAEGHWLDSGEDILQPTHWMPLPPEPAT